MARKYSFKYPYAAYMDVSTMRETKTRKELIQEYRAMQQEANRRLKGLGKYKWTSKSKAYERNAGKYRESAFELHHMTKDAIAKKMREAARFLTAQSSTVKGQRQARDRMIDTFRIEWGLEFVNRNNIKEFAEFLEVVREEKGIGKYNMSAVDATYKLSLYRKNFDLDKIKAEFEDWESKLKKDELYETYLRRAQERQDQA